MKKTKLGRNGLAPCNGRPQLYHSVGVGHDRLRIVYPDGLVEYAVGYEGAPIDGFRKGCTSRRTQLEALQAVQRYSMGCVRGYGYEDLVFLGYL